MTENGGCLVISHLNALVLLLLLLRCERWSGGGLQLHCDSTSSLQSDTSAPADKLARPNAMRYSRSLDPPSTALARRLAPPECQKGMCCRGRRNGS